MQRSGRILLSLILLLSFSSVIAQNPELIIHTDLGNITVEVYTEKAPITASNFLNLVKHDVYSKSLFYRAVRMDNQPQNKVKIEVIQGGLYNMDLVNMYPPIPHETTETTGIRHTNGVISMARLEPGTASTEFFICVGDQPSLDFGGARNPDGQGFAAFGKVIKGIDVVRNIQFRPDSIQLLLEPVFIRDIKLLK
jgi:peptidyl-prolyl cis-trans isomerase A (cyclophilin A)